MEAVVMEEEILFRTTQEGPGTIQFSLGLTVLGLHVTMPDNQSVNHRVSRTTCVHNTYSFQNMLDNLRL
jgi:hypothetical protein